MTSTTVVSGEAVVLDLRPATFIQRAAGLLIDLVVYAVAAIVLVMLAGVFGLDQAGEATVQAVALTLVVTVLVILPWLWETLSRGKSVGKWVMGLRVLRDDGGAIRSRHALLRTLTGVLEIWMLAGSVALLVSISHERGKRLGDLAAGTTLVVERAPKIPPPLPGVPEYMRSWADSADIGRVPDELAVAITRYLRQAPKMSPAGQAHLSQQLLVAVSPWISPPPPVEAGVNDVLLAVVAERRNRDYRILARRREEAAQRAEQLRAVGSVQPAEFRQD